MGFTIGAGTDSWSYWQYSSAAVELLSKDFISPDAIRPKDFVDDQIKYLENSKQISDDVIRSAMPFASVPWMEAILGCPVISTDAHMTAKAFLDNLESFEYPPFDPDNAWVKKYLEFIEVYSKISSGNFPVTQSILRGPSDLACAMLGVDAASIALLTQPDAMHKLLDYIANHLEQFLKLQLDILPKFHDGYVIGQYEIWAPAPVIRIQEDFSVLYSPELYNEFLKPLDEKLSKISEYTLIHLHSTSLFLIDQYLEVSQIRVFQTTKDPDGTELQDMIPSLKKIQIANKPLIVKGRFDLNDINLMKQELSSNGLCIQPVVSNLSEAESLLPDLRNWN